MGHGINDNLAIKNDGAVLSAQLPTSNEHLGIAFHNDRTASVYSIESGRISNLPEFKKLDSLYQFAINYADPSLQNRRRHSEDVARVAIEASRRLGLSEASAQLAGTIALAHDIGHPPFSHWGEKAINARLAPCGLHWNHDTSGLSILVGSKKTPGIGLSPETIEGIAKRFWRFDPSAPVGRGNHSLDTLPAGVVEMNRETGDVLRLNCLNHLEGQIAAQADIVSFTATDIQDGLRVGRLTPEMLREHFPSAYSVYHELLTAFVEAYKFNMEKPYPVTTLERALVSDPSLHDVIFRQFGERFRAHLLDNLVSTTLANLDSGIRSGKLMTADDVRNQPALLADFGSQMQIEMADFQAFCRREIYANKTALLEPIIGSVIEVFLSEEVDMKMPYSQRFKEASSKEERLLVVAEYMARQMGDRDALVLAQRHAPETYRKNFPGYESALAKPLTMSEAYARLTHLISAHDRLGGYVGMPIIHASELDFRPGHSIPVVSSTRKYVLPVPEVGETIQVPYDGKKRSGESYNRGEPIFDWRGSPLSGQGVVFFNSDDDQWVAAPCGLQGAKRSVFIVNEVSEVQARLLDEKRSTWMDPQNPSMQELKDILAFASGMHIVEGLSTEQTEQLLDYVEDCVRYRLDIQSIVARTPDFLLTQDIVRSASDPQQRVFQEELSKLSPSGTPNRTAIIAAIDTAYGGLRNIYPSNCAYVLKSLPGIKGFMDGPESLYGYRMRDRSEIFHAIYIDHPFEFASWEGNPERSYEGAVVIQRNSGVGICQNFRAIQSYEHPDGTKLKIEDIPIQRRSSPHRYKTTHDVECDIATTVTIVGAGVSGLAAAVHLIKNFPIEKLVSHKLRINLIDSANEPAGSTYNRPDANIVGMANPIGVLGIDMERGCLEFLNQNPESWIGRFPSLREGFNPETRCFDPRTIITHNQYGEFVKDYFASILRDLEKSSAPIEVNFIQDKVISASARTVSLKGGGRLEADAIVYCVGNALPKPITQADQPDRKLDGISGYHRLDDQAWSLGNINESDSTVVLGTANGALFGALWAVGNGYTGKFTLVSSSGTVPERVGISRPYERRYLTVDHVKRQKDSGRSITTDGLKNLFLRDLVQARREGKDWRDVVDSLACDTNAIWACLSSEEQMQFGRRYMAAWNNARYRIPDHHWSQIEKLQAEGRLEIVGGLRGITPLDQGGFEVRISEPDGSERRILTKKIVNNTGPSRNFEEMPDCIRTLIQGGDARLHHISGLDVDSHFRIKNGSGLAHEAVYAIGPIVSGAHPEAITVPAIRESAGILAHAIVDQVIMSKERAYQGQLRALAELYKAPTSPEVVEYVRNVIARRPVGDPRDPNDPTITPTHKIYFSEHESSGTRYTPARERVHAAIIEQALAGKEPVPGGQRPSFLSVAGGMSVGMTYLQRLIMAEGVLDPKNTVVITPLSFKPLHEFDIRNHYQHTEKSPLLCDEYYDIVRKIVARCIDQRLNVMWVDQADAKEPLLSLLKAAKTKQYDSAILALTMTPEAYHAASELWLHKFNRIPDHRRGFGDLREFAENWPIFARHFDQAELYETRFHTEDIDKDPNDGSRREYTVKPIARAYRDPSGEAHQIILEPQRYFDFLDRGAYINPESNSPEDARRDFPYRDFVQLDPHTHLSPPAPEPLPEQQLEGLHVRLAQFRSGNFEEKFKQLVRSTSAARAARARKS